MRHLASCTLSGSAIRSLTLVMPVQSITVSGNSRLLHMTHWEDNLAGSTLAMHRRTIRSARAKGAEPAASSSHTNSPPAAQLLPTVDHQLGRHLLLFLFFLALLVGRPFAVIRGAHVRQFPLEVRAVAHTVCTGSQRDAPPLLLLLLLCSCSAALRARACANSNSIRAPSQLRTVCGARAERPPVRWQPQGEAVSCAPDLCAGLVRAPNMTTDCLLAAFTPHSSAHELNSIQLSSSSLRLSSALSPLLTTALSIMHN